MKTYNASSLMHCLKCLAFATLLSAGPVGAALPPGFAEGSVAMDDANRFGVIVQLDVDFVPEGKLSGQKVVTQRSAISRAQAAVLDAIKNLDIAGVYRFQYTPDMAIYASEEAIAAIEKTPGVVAVHPDRLSSLALTETVPLIGADSTGYSGATSAVAVLDSGVDSDHVHLWGHVISEACYSANAGVFHTNCPGGTDEETGPGTGAPCDLMPDCAHGTHVAGIAAGGLLTGGTIQGVAIGARIISIQIMRKATVANACTPDPPPCLRTTTSDQKKALQRVLDLHYNDPIFSYYRIAAVNMSVGSSGGHTSYCDTDTRKADIDNLRSVGIPTVVASGNGSNSNELGSPACISSAISVGNTTDKDEVFHESNSAWFLTLLAPGTSIYSPFAGGGYSERTGTSFAAPHVSGAFAQLKEKNPNATVDQMLDALTSTGVPVEDSRNGITKPRIQVDAAIKELP